MDPGFYAGGGQIFPKNYEIEKILVHSVRGHAMGVPPLNLPLFVCDNGAYWLIGKIHLSGNDFYLTKDTKCPFRYCFKRFATSIEFKTK